MLQRFGLLLKLKILSSGEAIIEDEMLKKYMNCRIIQNYLKRYVTN